MAVYLWNAGQKVNLQYPLSDLQNVGLQLLLPKRNFYLNHLNTIRSHF